MTEKIVPKKFDIENYHRWYFNADIKFRIIKYTKNRETVLMKKTTDISQLKFTTFRMRKIHSVQHLDAHLREYNWQDYKLNMYYSLAKYKNGIPNASFKPNEVDYTNWNENNHKEMVEFDFLIDVDSPDHESIGFAQESAINISEHLTRDKTPHEIRFSGCGFHIIVPYSHFKDKGYSFTVGHPNSIYKRYKELATELYIKYSELIDLGIYEHRRITKIPYSIAIYGTELYVCMPITIEKLNNFNLSDYTPEEVMKCLEKQP